MKGKIVSFFLSKFNTSKFSDLVKKSKILIIPYKYVAQRLIDFKFPSHLFIEVTNACNLRCNMCTRNLVPMKIGTMDFALFKKIVDEASNYGPRTFSLHLFGEPLLAPNIISMVDYIKQKNCLNNILLTTNGIFLTNKVAEGIIKYQVDKLIVSIHGSDREKYKVITGVDKLEQVEKNVKYFLELKRSASAKKPIVYLRIIIRSGTEEDINSFRKKWETSSVVLDIREQHNFGGKILTSQSLDKFKQRYPCYHLWFSPGINWDGEVSICCCDVAREVILGNVKNESIAKIWQSDKLKEYRSYHLRGEYSKMPLCENCDVWRTYQDIFFKRQKNKKL